MEFIGVLLFLLLVAPVWALVTALGLRSRVEQLERELRELRAAPRAAGATREQDAVPTPLAPGQARTLPEQLSSTPGVTERGSTEVGSEEAHATRGGPGSPEATTPLPTTAPPAMPQPMSSRVEPAAELPGHVAGAAGPPASTGALPPPPLPAYSERGSLHSRAAEKEGRAGLDPWAWLVRFFSGPSAFARLGAVLLLIGVGLLLKYAADLGVLGLPLRLGGIVTVGVAFFAVGWRLRSAQPAFAYALQGTAFGLWYLTVYAAMRYYDVLQPGVAFVLLALLGVALVGAAAAQGAQVLALLGLIGGFLAPVLTAGDHGESSRALQYAYLAVLNAGALWLGARRGWLALPALAFVATHVIQWVTLPGAGETRVTANAFAAVVFLAYALLPLMTVRADRRDERPTHGIVAALVVANPVAFLAVLAAPGELARATLAGVCVGLAVLYAVLAWRFSTLRTLHAALGVGSLTLAVPFALGARLLPAAWAFEGTVLAWYGARARRSGWSFAAAGAHVLAGAAAFDAVFLVPAAPWATWVQGATLAVAAALSARFTRPVAPALAEAFAVWSLVAWFVTGANAILRGVWGGRGVSWLLVYGSASALAYAWLGAASALRAWRAVAFVPVPAAALIAVTRLGLPPFAQFAGAAFTVAVAAQLALLEWRGFAFPERARLAYHAMTTWLATLLLTWAAADAAAARLGAGWVTAAWVVGPSLAVAALAVWGTVLPWLRRAFEPFVRVALLPLLAVSLAGAWLAGFGSAEARPYPTWPILNPLDLALLAVWVVAWSALTHAGASRTPELTGAMRPVWAAFPPRFFAWFLGVSGMAWASLATLRAVSLVTGAPWAASDVWQSGVAQAALTLLWAGVGVGAVLWATRRATRAVWVAGAGVLLIVTLKLFLVDLAGSSAVARIVSFVGVGGLLLLIGYLAPVPPRDEVEEP